MRELSISFFLLFLLFVCLDVSTTSYSLGMRNALLEEIDNRLDLSAVQLKDAVEEDKRIDLDFKKLYPILTEYSLGWVELFDSSKNLIVSSDFNELLNYCHRILVLYQGALRGELKADQMQKQGLLNMVMGN